MKETLRPWREWFKARFGYVGLRDFGSQKEFMTLEQFNESMLGQTVVVMEGD